MAAVTNKLKYRMLEKFFRSADSFYVFLATSAAAVVADTNTKSELTEVATGNGYTAGGISLTGNATDFDVLTEDDANDRAYVQIKDLTWTASGGNLPSSGSGAREAVLTDANATPASREVFCGWDLVSDRTVSDTQALILQNPELRIA